MNASRLLIILHPNTERVDIILTDKMFNNEQYRFSRSKPPTGNEERLLKRLGKLFAIQKAEASKCELSLDLRDGFLYTEFMPQVLEYVREFVGPDFSHEVYVDDRRRVGDRWNDMGDLIDRGRAADRPNLGFDFKDWHEGKH